MSEFERIPLPNPSCKGEVFATQKTPDDFVSYTRICNNPGCPYNTRVTTITDGKEMLTKKQVVKNAVKNFIEMRLECGRRISSLN